MTIRDMKVFLAVCEMQSMSAAAAKLNISQSAVSQAIRAIEKHFDTKMFDRVGNKVYLTDSGREVDRKNRERVRLVDEIMMNGLSEAEQEQLMSLLLKMRENLIEELKEKNEAD